MGTWPRALNLVDINGLDSKIWSIEVAGGGGGDKETATERRSTTSQGGDLSRHPEWGVRVSHGCS